MWNISQEEAANFKILRCAKHESGIVIVISCSSNTVYFNLVAVDTSLYSLLLARINQQFETFNLELLKPELNLSGLKFSDDISNDLLRFSIIIEQLNITLPEFTQVHNKLKQIIPVNNQQIKRTLEKHRHARNAAFLTQRENTMHPMVFVSARRSELALRAAYDFPAPMYAMDMAEDEITENDVMAIFTGTLHSYRNAVRARIGTPATLLISEQAPLLRAIFDEDNDEYDSEMDRDDPPEEFDDAHEQQIDSDADMDSQEIDYPPTPDSHTSADQEQFNLDAAARTDQASPLQLGSNLQYSSEENDLINDLQQTLENIRNKYVETGDIILRNNNFELSNQLLNALRVAPNQPKDPNLTRAQFCLDLLTAIRAIYPTGSHADNFNMALTQIYGYGLRNLVALIWHCITTAAAAKPVRFMNGVTAEAAIEALIHGIADGARGNNRNEESGIDDLAAEDRRSCDKGRYNSLIAAMQGIFAEVEIKYDYFELFLLELKKDMYHLLLKFTQDDLLTALGIITNWSSKNPILVPEYEEFVAVANMKFPSMQTQFLNTTFANDPEFKAKIEQELKRLDQNLVEQGFGFSFIEQISLKAEEYQAFWSEYYEVSEPKLTVDRPSIRMSPVVSV